MNTKVLEKIYKGNVELSEVNVELATVKEIDTKLKSFGLPFSDINKVGTSVSSVQNALRILEKSINETLQEAKQLEIKAKELGIDAGLENGVKYANEKLKQVSSANTLFSRFNAEIEKLK